MDTAQWAEFNIVSQKTNPCFFFACLNEVFSVIWWDQIRGTLCWYQIKECILHDFVSILFTASYEFYCVLWTTKFLNMLYFRKKISWLYLVDLPWLAMCLVGLVVRHILYSVYYKIFYFLCLAAPYFEIQFYEDLGYCDSPWVSCLFWNSILL